MREWKMPGRAARMLVSVLLIAALVLFAAACGSSEEKKDADAAGQQDGMILYVGDGNFVVSGYSADYENTDVHMILDDEDLGSVGGAKSAGASYVLVGTNVKEAVPEETEGYQKLVVQAFGSPDLSKDELSENCVEKTFYVKCAEGSRFTVNAIIGTDEVTSPPDWDWE